MSENYDIDLTLQGAFLDQSWTEKGRLEKEKISIGWTEMNQTTVKLTYKLI